MRELNKQMKKVLSSGQTNVSKFNLDLMRRLRHKNGDGDAGGVTGQSNRDGLASNQQHLEEDLSLADIAALANYDDDALEEFLATI